MGVVKSTAKRTTCRGALVVYPDTGIERATIRETCGSSECRRLVTEDATDFLEGADKISIEFVILRVPCLLLVPEGHIVLVRLHVVVVAEVLVGHLCSLVVELLHAREDVLVERTLPVGEGIASQLRALEVHLYLFQQSVGRSEEPEAGIVGFEVFFLAALEGHHRVGWLSAVTCMYFLEIDGFCHESASDRLVNSLIYIFYVVSVCFFHTFEFPFGDDLPLGTADIGYCTFEYGSLATIDILDALLVCNLPIIVRRTVALADDTAEVAALTGVELAVSLAWHLLTTVGNAHPAVVAHRREHRAGHEVGLGLLLHVIARHSPAGVKRNGGHGEIPALAEPSAATLTAVLNA